LLTGGCGKIGSYFVRFASDQYFFRVADKVAWDTKKLGSFSGESLVADLQNLDACRQACEGMEMVIHLAADPSPDADFMGSLLGNNIVATYNLFRAAREAGCRRVIYASSIHAVGAYPEDVQVKADMAVRPNDFYGVSKCFGEALAAYYAFNEGLPSIALRIGAYLFPHEIGLLAPHEQAAFINPDDFNNLLIKCLEKPGITFAIAHAISDNKYKRLDLTETKELFDYEPKVDVFDELENEDSAGSKSA
jgi:nucleoside-diphosphate-sugar epimerase